jgi:hypothetical protein
MNDRRPAANFSGYGYKAESISLFEKVREYGLAATAFSRRGLRQDPLGQPGLAPKQEDADKVTAAY